MIDNIDRQLIRYLQNDGRVAYSTLGKMVGLSDAATRQRVKRLESIGVIEIVAVTDPRKLGYGHQAMIGVRTSGDITAVAEAIGQVPEAHYVVVVAGRYDIMSEVVCAGPGNLLAVTNSIRQIDGVLHVEVSPYLAVTKETYDWGAGKDSSPEDFGGPAQ